MTTYYNPYYYPNSRHITEISYFTGQDVDGWLSQVESLFYRHQTTPEQKLAVGTFYLAGDALEWYRQWYWDKGRSWRSLTWDNFAADLRCRFGSETLTCRSMILESMSKTGAMASIQQSIADLSEMMNQFLKTQEEMRAQRAHMSKILEQMQSSVDEPLLASARARKQSVLEPDNPPTAEIVGQLRGEMQELKSSQAKADYQNDAEEKSSSDQHQYVSPSTKPDLIFEDTAKIVAGVNDEDLDGIDFDLDSDLVLSKSTAVGIVHTEVISINSSSSLVLQKHESKNENVESGLGTSVCALNDSLNGCPASVRQNAYEMLIYSLPLTGKPPPLPPEVARNLVIYHVDPTQGANTMTSMRNLLETGDVAAERLVGVLNDGSFYSIRGKNEHRLWLELCDLLTKHATEVSGLNVNAIIRGGIGKFTDEIGRLWTSLADYYVRRNQTEKARGVLSEGMTTVVIMRDFSVIFDAYSRFEESMLAPKMENIDLDDLSIWWKISGVFTSSQVKVVDGNFVYDKGKGHKYNKKNDLKTYEHLGQDIGELTLVLCVFPHELYILLGCKDVLLKLAWLVKPPPLPPEICHNRSSHIGNDVSVSEEKASRRLFEVLSNPNCLDGLQAYSHFLVLYINGEFVTAYGIVSRLPKHKPCYSYELLNAILIRALGRNEKMYEALLSSQRQIFTPLTYNAYVVFDCMPVRNSISWNALIAGYAELGECEMVIQLFGDMEREGVRIDDGTLAPLLALLNDPSFRKLTMQVHGKVMKCGLAFKTIVCNARINSYSECGSLEDAKHVFDGMAGFQDLVTWNSLLAAYVVHKQGAFALKVFIDMQASGFEPDVYTFTSVISSSLDDELGKSFHGLIFKKGLERSVPISNSLMSMYLKSDSKSLEEALRIYESMEKRDQVSWNSILAGFSQNRLSENALECFKLMLLEFVEIDQYAFFAVFKACSDLATLQLGQQVHNLAMKMGTDVFDYVVSSLIFMYCKCGCIEDSRKAFDETPQDSAIIWNTIIFGFAQHGQGNAALELFYSMKNRLVKPDHITFVAVLTACSHIGILGKVVAYGGAVQGLIMSVESPSAFIEDKTINQKNKFVNHISMYSLPRPPEIASLWLPLSFWFSSPRPPEVADLEDKVNFKDGGMLRNEILRNLGELLAFWYNLDMYKTKW